MTRGYVRFERINARWFSSAVAGILLSLLSLDAICNRINEQQDPGGVLVGNIAPVIDALNRVQQMIGMVQ